MKLIPKVTSLADLRYKAVSDAKYRKLLFLASANLGGPNKGENECYNWLMTNAMETDEEGVVEEVNFCRDLV